MFFEFTSIKNLFSGGYSIGGRLFTVDMKSSTNNLLIDFDIPAGLAGKLDKAFGSRNGWFDISNGNSKSATEGINIFTVIRTG